MKFNCSSSAQEFLETAQRRVRARSKSVLARGAVFLALGEGVPAGFSVADSQGVDLDENIILGGCKVAVRTALNRRAGRVLDEGSYRSEFRRHLEYGCQRVKE